MEEKYRIITHAGKAHLDELVACALLAVSRGTQPFEIIRQENRVTEALIKENALQEKDWVLDCGMEYDPSRRLYDHHQDGELPSAALLIFNEFFPELQGSRLHDSLMLLSRVDTGGIQSLNDYGSLDESGSYCSFSQKLLLKGFELDPSDAVRMVSEALKDSIEFEHMRNKALVWLENKEHTEVVEIEGVKVLAYRVQPPEELASALRSADKEMVDEQKIGAVFSFDEKNPAGRALFRTGHGLGFLDFSHCRPSETIFCHPGGFLLKFEPAREDEWLRLVRESLVSQSSDSEES
ncbi:MAG: MYG1 family protein [Spirochaetales bacterium]|nr:MYG1 family protein [Spirochaetales bacterium]